MTLTQPYFYITGVYKMKNITLDSKKQIFTVIMGMYNIEKLRIVEYTENYVIYNDVNDTNRVIALDKKHDSVIFVIFGTDVYINFTWNNVSKLFEYYYNESIEKSQVIKDKNDIIDYFKNENNELKDIIIRDNEVSDYYHSVITDMESKINNLNNSLNVANSNYNELCQEYEKIYNKLSYYENEYEAIIVPEKINALNEKYDDMVNTAKNIIDEKNDMIKSLQCQLKDITNKYNRDEEIINKVYAIADDIDNIESMKKDINYYKKEMTFYKELYYSVIGDLLDDSDLFEE